MLFEFLKMFHLVFRYLYFILCIFYVICHVRDVNVYIVLHAANFPAVGRLKVI